MGNRVKLVVVAAGTAQRQTENGLTERVDTVVGAVSLVLADIDRRVHLLAQIPETGTDNRSIASRCVEPGIVDEITGDLLANKPGVGKVFVERCNDPVAIPPGVGDRIIELVSPRFRESNHVEPVPGKPLAIVGRREQAVDVVFKGCRVGVGDDCRDIGRLRRQAREDFGRSANKHCPLRLSRRLQARRLETGQHEAVNVAATPVLVPHGRRRRGLWRVPAPVLGLSRGYVETGHRRLLAIIGPGQATANPVFERGNRFRGQLAIRWHLEVSVIADDIDEQALIGLASHHHSFGSEKVGPRIEGQAPFRLTGLGRVALSAVRHQQRPHPGFEKLRFLHRRWVGSTGWRGHRNHNEQEPRQPPGRHHRRSHSQKRHRGH